MERIDTTSSPQSTPPGSPRKQAAASRLETVDVKAQAAGKRGLRRQNNREWTKMTQNGRIAELDHKKKANPLQRKAAFSVQSKKGESVRNSLSNVAEARPRSVGFALDRNATTEYEKSSDSDSE